MSLTTTSPVERRPMHRTDVELPEDTRSLALKAEQEARQARWALVWATAAIFGSTLIRAVFFDSQGAGVWVDIALGLIQVGVLGAAVHFSRAAPSSHVYHAEENTTANEVTSTKAEQNDVIAEADQIEADHAATLDEIETVEATAGHEIEAQHHNIGRQKEWMRGMADQFASDVPGDSLYDDIENIEPSRDLDRYELHAVLWGHLDPPGLKTPVVADELRAYSHRVEEFLTNLEYTAATAPEPEIGELVEGMPTFCPWDEPTGTDTGTNRPASPDEATDGEADQPDTNTFVFMDDQGRKFAARRVEPQKATTNGHSENGSNDA
jgi:hypothetical protein